LQPSARHSGATIDRLEGIFRRHMTIEDIGVRDPACYSITDLEWSDMSPNLQLRLAAARACNSEPVQ
jgi:hypothetical protein